MIKTCYKSKPALEFNMDQTHNQLFIENKTEVALIWKYLRFNITKDTLRAENTHKLM